MHPGHISIKDYTYILPEEKIARYPSPERDAAKLLIYKNGSIREDTYQNIGRHLPSNTLLVFNDTRVIEARLLFHKETGGIIEIFCLEPHEQYADITSAMLQQEKVLWKCLVGGASKWKHGQVLEKKTFVKTSEITLLAVYKEKRADYFIIELSWQPANMSFAEILHLHGAIPLPPYLKREAESRDQERYQTVYAHHEGLCCSPPTAGLPFTDTIFENLEKKDIRTDFVTLHVGAGTFKPVKSETMQEHEMHAEFMDVSFNTVQNIIRHLPDNIVAVGTTSLRTIESLYWIGVKLLADECKPVSEITQWEVYDELSQHISAVDALQALLQWLKKNGRDRLMTRTQIIIAPGYKLRIAKGLITNFHQPASTLLLLVAALIGDNWKKVYDYALENEFRFLSYGDGSLLWKS